MKISRWWFYHRSTGDRVSWWNRLGIPWLSVDEHGRRVIIWGTGLTGYLCYAYWTCHCEDCTDARTEQELLRQWGDDIDADLRVQFVQKDGTGAPRV
jgi:hypothetical protein